MQTTAARPSICVSFHTAPPLNIYPRGQGDLAGTARAGADGLGEDKRDFEPLLFH